MTERRWKSFGAWHPTWHEPSNFHHDTAEAAKASLERTYGPNSGHIVVEVRVVPVDTVYIVKDAEPWKETA